MKSHPIFIVQQRRGKNFDEPAAAFNKLPDLLAWLTRRKLVIDEWDGAEGPPSWDSLAIYQASDRIDQDAPIMLGTAELFLSDADSRDLPAAAHRRVVAQRAIRVGLRTGL